VISAHLPALQIILPLIAASICVLLRPRGLVWPFVLLVSWGSLAIAAMLLSQVLESGPLSYALGGWSAPWGIEYRIDLLNAYILLLVTLIGAVVLTYAPASVSREIDEDRRPYFYAAFLLCLTGLLGITITGDAFNVFVFLEISSLSTYGLISLGRDRRALTAAYNYLILGTIGATFILIGIGLMYMMTGTLNMADLAVRLQAVNDTRTIHVAFAFLSVGFTLKLALFPLHVWLPNAYCYAPSTVSAFIAATATKVSVYAFLRFVFTIFGADFAFGTMHIDILLLPLSLLGIFIASAVAIYQTDLKRLLAYSSVAQIGYIMLGVSFGSVTGLTAGIVHLFNHALMKSALFLAVGCIYLRISSVQLDDLSGLGKRLPATSFAFVLGGLGLVGVPLTVGFISKWYLILGALERGWWPVAVLVLISSLMALVYIWRFVEIAYFRPVPEGAQAIEEAPLSMQIPMWLLLALSIGFGVQTSLTADIAQRAALWLLGGAP
jgi:multicomponent Na+:H+ antiporter subunit D